MMAKPPPPSAPLTRALYWPGLSVRRRTQSLVVALASGKAATELNAALSVALPPQAVFSSIFVFVALLKNSSFGLAIVPGMLKGAVLSVGPTARTSTFMLVVPPTTNPAVNELLAAIDLRTETFTSRGVLSATVLVGVAS